MLNIKKPIRGKAIKIIEVERATPQYICFPKSDIQLSNEGLYKLTTIVTFSEEYQARWHCICNPDMTYKISRRVHL